MAEVPGEIKLNELLLKFKISHIYTKLIEQQFDSLEIIKECSEDDISALCKSLNLSLLDKLRFKRALKSVHIPQHPLQTPYAIINKQEQSYIIAIDNSIKRMEHIITSPNKNDTLAAQRYKQNENMIHSAFDMLIAKLNQQRDELLKQLKGIYDHRDYHNKEMFTYLHSAKHIKQQCHKLIIKNTNLNELDCRTNSIKTLNDQCLNTEQRIIDLKSKIESNIESLRIHVQNDDDQQRFVGNFVTICEEQKGTDTDQSLPTDTSATDIHNINLYIHNPVRALKLNHTTNKWIPRGLGTVSLWYDKKQNITKLIFVDGESHSTTLLQCVNEHSMTSLKCVKEGCISWESQSPQKGLWILRFMGNHNAAAEFLETLNDQIQMSSHTKVKLNIRKLPYVIAHSKSAQSVMDDGSFQQTIAIKKLYCFGNDAHGVACWNIRASHTTIQFVQCYSTGKIKLVVKEPEHGSLAINHYIPVRNANLILKQDLVYQWNVLDESFTVITTWSAKFYTTRDTENFRLYFNKSVYYNTMAELKRNRSKNDINLDAAVSVSDIEVFQLEHSSRSVPPPQQEESGVVVSHHNKPPELAACKSWDGPASGDSSSVVIVRPWSRYISDDTRNMNDHLEIISDHKQTEVTEQDIQNDNDFDLICKVPIKSLHRWCVARQCWQLRAAETRILFYKHRGNNHVRLLCKMEYRYGDNDGDSGLLLLNHWMPSNDVANIKYKDKQFLWSADDYCVDTQKHSTFAVKFFNDADAETFQRQFVYSNCSN
eukprot:1052583_1